MKIKYIIAAIILIFCISSCHKYLGEKPDKKLVVPTTVQDLQGVLDYYNFMNVQCSNAGDIASDDYYLTDQAYLSLSADRMRNAYLWQPGLFTGNYSDWQNEYNVVYNANIVLEGIQNIARDLTNDVAWDNCKGSALLFRGKSFLEITQIWAKAFDSATANSDLGIPLRLTSDFNVGSVRANLKDTYKQIINDLQSSIPLLPNVPAFPFRPSKPAAYGLLARTFLAMRDYGDALLYADSCLHINNQLLNYNTLNVSASFPFASLQYTNKEDIMHSICGNYANSDIQTNYGKIDTGLYRSYSSNDMRKVIYFALNPDGTVYFQGSYDGGYSYFNGVATDEIYLIESECFARQNKIDSAMYYLNTLLANRWKSGTFVPFTGINSTSALSLILTERRKELIFRTLRFTDIKRLNMEGANMTLKRIIQGQTYTLQPNDSKYALPIPDQVLQLSGILQN